MALIELGGLGLEGFEVPARVSFGGAQRAAVHKLLGGGRVIDAMGRDDSALVWSGIFAGESAGDRARTLDAMRVDGATLFLAWDAFCYNVIIGRLELEYSTPWWIAYRIECIVVSDLAQSNAVVGPNLADSILADLATVSGIVDVEQVQSALSLAGALSPGAAGLATAYSSLALVGSQVQAGIVASEQGLGSNDVAMLLSSSQELAQLASAQGYLGRSLTNIQGLLS